MFIQCEETKKIFKENLLNKNKNKKKNNKK